MAKDDAFLCQLKTPFEEDMTTDWSEYPRPQLKRDSYISLCGRWELSVVTDTKEEALGEITVPFVPESRLSGIFRSKAKNEKYIYRRTFTIDDGFNIGRILLHFGAVDQIAKVWINERAVGEHTGGYLPFTFDIGEFIKVGENTIRVEVVDTLDAELAYGKQRYKRGGMWYTPISGIWQAVWLESVPEDYIKSLRITPATGCVAILSSGGRLAKKLTLHTDEGDIEYIYEGDHFVFVIDSPKLWSPENPYLYYFTLTDGVDTVESYFALRTISIEKRNKKPYLCLNGEPYFFHGLLDQGYFSDGIYLPATPTGYIWDIQNMKQLGFNMLRKHIKIEPDLFYYYCDKYGMIVFQDMVNSGKYHYFIDTVLPTIGLRRGITHSASKRRREHFENDSKQTIELLFNHPCVCYYTIFNEGWGQYDADETYQKIKSLDRTRIYDATSGWFSEKESDVKSEHIYFKKIKLKADKNKPLVLSEFGGYSCKIEGHSFNLKKNYGYKTFASAEELTKGLEDLYFEQIIPQIKNGLCATVLTQVSDVEDETNGLCTYDRQIIKVDKTKMQAISQKLKEAFENSIE